MSKWLTLSDSMYLFGENSINRIESMDNYLSTGIKSEYKTALYNNSNKITVVKETIKEIEEMLNG